MSQAPAGSRGILLIRNTLILCYVSVSLKKPRSPAQQQYPERANLRLSVFFPFLFYPTSNLHSVRACRMLLSARARSWREAHRAPDALMRHAGCMRDHRGGCTRRFGSGLLHAGSSQGTAFERRRVRRPPAASALDRHTTSRWRRVG